MSPAHRVIAVRQLYRDERNLKKGVCFHDWLYVHIGMCRWCTYYTGSTKNLKYRLWQHDNFQGANYTRKKHPSKLVYYEKFSRIDHAFYREKQIQGWSHKKKQALIEGNITKLSNLGKKDFSKRVSCRTIYP